MRSLLKWLTWPFLLGALGCQPSDPLDRMVKAQTPAAFTSWRTQATNVSADQRRQVEDALQEIRLNVAAEREQKRAKGEPANTSAESIDEGVRDRIHGRPLREVVQLGYEMREFRLTRELAALEEAMNQNAQLVTRPGDVASRQHLDGLRDRMNGRVEKYRADIAAAKRDLAPLQQKAGRRLYEPPAAPTDKPEEMPERISAPTKK